METRRRVVAKRPEPKGAAANQAAGRAKTRLALASDALPLPANVTNKFFLVLFFLSSYYLMRRWREKIRTNTLLHLLTFWEIVAILSFLSSFIYLFGFFGIIYVQPFVSRSSEEWDDLEPEPHRQASPACAVQDPLRAQPADLAGDPEEEVIMGVVNGSVPSHTLESRLGDCRRAAGVRRKALEIVSGRSVDGLPLDGFDYGSILGQCCELPIGYVQIPVGIAGPLLMKGKGEVYVPMATTEGCLVASTNRGCKAIYASGGVDSVCVRDGMSRAPAVRLASARRAAELKFFLEDPMNFETVSMVFNRTSRFARLQSIKCALAGRILYMRFVCATGDAMGMNMVSKGVQNVLDFLRNDFPDMDIISLSGNYCSDKKPAAVNWIEGRGKSVVCDAIIKEEVVRSVLKTSVSALVDLNNRKNLVGSAVAGSLGGFNAHASNIVSAIFIATGQDPAQNVESSQCITMMEFADNGKDLYISVSMPCIEVGTVGGGTQLASQSACLNLLGAKGSNMETPGANATKLALVVAGAVLAGELSLMSALAAGQLVKSHMKYNRSSKDICASAASCT
ncbi:3-hydroxy-3-methylglutaryl-coenzyme A reductase 1 [Nymphaea thermarum]|nr:3-hydroxy-3-methylglutaryl-coenzyme A reductase 1 [Nymphaea thermarum]